MKNIYDLIIVGGGPAGMSAALYASRQNLKFLLITETLGGLANLVPTLKTYLGFYYITGYELIDKFKTHLKQYSVPIKEERVIKISKDKKIFSITTNKNQYESRVVIAASGRRFKKLGIPGEEKFTGKGVSDCTACDGPLFKGRTVAVIGGGRTGLFASLYLLKLAKRIYLIEKENRIKTSGGLKQFAKAIKNNKKVEILLSTKPKEIRGDKFVKDIVLLKNNKTEILPIEGVFVEIGYIPNTEFLKGFTKTNDMGEIIVDAEGRTDIDGLFAAGDVTNIKEKQVVVSVGEGAKATLSAITYLERIST